MKTLEDVLELMQDRVDRSALEEYISHEWVRPHRNQTSWHFEEIDIARLELICYLKQDIEVNNEGMDVVLSLLDQLYGMRGYMKLLSHAINQQPPEVQAKIKSLLNQLI